MTNGAWRNSQNAERRTRNATSPFPLRPQDAVYPQIYEVIIEPFHLPQDPFLLQAEAFTDRLARLVPNRHADFDAVQVQVSESIVDQAAHAGSHESASGIILSQPVTDGSVAMKSGDCIKSDDSDNFGSEEDTVIQPETNLSPSD